MEFIIDTNNVILSQIDQVESGEYNVTECEFSFSEEYEGLTKKAIFTGEDGIAYLQTIVDNKCAIPSEILQLSQKVEIGVYGYSVENEELILRYSPKPTRFYIHQGSYKEAQNSTPPTPSEIEQLQSQITQNANDIDTVKTNVEEIQSDIGNMQGDITNIKAEQTQQDTNIQNNTDNITTLQNTKADKSEIPTKTSQLINDSDFVVDNNYIHTDNNFTNADKTQITTNKDNITTLESIKADKSEIPDVSNFVTKDADDLTNYTKTSDLATVAISGSYNDLTDKPTIPSKTSDLTNDSGFVDKSVNDLTYYTLKTSTGSLIDLEINSTTYVITLNLKNQDGTVISTDTIDLPLESVVVGGRYDSANQKIVLTLENGNTVDIPVGDLVAGLQTEITSSNKLASDLVDDTNSGNKFVTTSEKQTWNAKYDKPSGGIPSTDMTSEVQTSLGKADTAVQPTDYATDTKGGVFKVSNSLGLYEGGFVYAYVRNYSRYQTMGNEHFISKGTLENVITGKNLETANNKVTSLSSSSTDTQYPSAKCVYDIVGNIESILQELDTGGGVQ